MRRMTSLLRSIVAAYPSTASVIAVAFGILVGDPRVASAGSTPIQKCQAQVIKTTQQYLTLRTAQLGKCLVARAAVDLSNADPTKAEGICEKGGATVQAGSAKAVAKIAKLCMPVEQSIVDP